MRTHTALRRVAGKPDSHTGAAMVESILIVGVLLIFMLGIPMIGSLIDLKQTTIQASRYSAWEKTVHVDPQGKPNLIDERFFKDPSAPITSAPNNGLAPNLLWGELEQGNGQTVPDGAQANNGNTPPGGPGPDMSKRARVTIAGPVGVYEVVGESALAGVGSNMVGLPVGSAYRTVGTVVTEIGRAVSRDGWEDGDPVEDGLVASIVESQFQANELLPGGAIREKTSIFIDGWAAAEPETIRERVHGFVPSHRLERVGDFISRVKFIPMLNDLEHLEKAFGCVKTNIVPGKTYAPVSDNPIGLTVYNPAPGDDC